MIRPGKSIAELLALLYSNFDNVMHLSLNIRTSKLSMDRFIEILEEKKVKYSASKTKLSVYIGNKTVKFWSNDQYTDPCKTRGLPFFDVTKDHSIVDEFLLGEPYES